MRTKDRAEVADLVRAQLAPVNGYLAKIMAVLAELGNDLAEIKPAQVDLTQEMADDIVRKIHGPLTIGQEFSDSLRRLAEYCDWYQTFPFGYGGPDSGRLELRAKADGALHLQITDFKGAPMWQGTFVPPGYGT